MFHDTDTAWIIEQSINFLAPVITVVVALLIAARGYKNGLKQQAKDHQQEFQIRLYEKLTSASREASSALSTYNSLLQIFSINVKMDYEAQQAGRMCTDWKRRPPMYMDAHFSFTKAVTQLIIEVETIEIVEPRLKIFRIALSCLVRDIGNLYGQNSEYFFHYSSKDFVTSNGQMVAAQPDKISIEVRDTIDANMQKMSDLLIDVSCILDDLRIDLQNLLLGEFFPDNKVEHRKPIDPSKVVVSIKDFDKLEKHFKENTEAGREQEEIIRTLKEQHSK